MHRPPRRPRSVAALVAALALVASGCNLSETDEPEPPLTDLDRPGREDLGENAPGSGGAGNEDAPGFEDPTLDLEEEDEDLDVGENENEGEPADD